MNRIFGRGPNSQHNACVGNNGQPDASDYAEGYSTAAKMLIDTYLESSTTVFQDLLVYPICFNMRHSIEITLKNEIYRSISINKIKEIEVYFDNKKTHDINVIWEFLSRHLIVLDRQYKPILNTLEPLMNEIGSVDPTGQTFRYPENVDGHRHLVKVSLINIERLKFSFKLIERHLRDLVTLGEIIFNDYKTKTFTNNLSRNDIRNISKRLPSKVSWPSVQLTEAKGEIKRIYGISNTECKKCLKIIQSHYEFSANIGLELKLDSLSEIDINHLCEAWRETHGNTSTQSQKRIITTQELREEIDTDSNRGEIFEAFKETLTIDKVVAIESLFYFGYELDYSENYLEKAKLLFGEYTTRASEEHDLLERAISEILDKVNALKNIKKSLYFLNQIKLADTINTIK
ncbi:hypothetical protein [Cobetia amphilecti]|uniref:Uncharacterized protein n=1 Tax=Cobetia amphilecti TaxID=1055104 RepID=A0AAP4U0B7_9GAMM|nr:hypothetical protein [Cobetia amphilecti]MDO6673018.1 hypothetical protein [Cobetia amphilecti]